MYFPPSKHLEKAANRHSCTSPLGSDSIAIKRRIMEKAAVMCDRALALLISPCPCYLQLLRAYRGTKAESLVRRDLALAFNIILGRGFSSHQWPGFLGRRRLSLTQFYRGGLPLAEKVIPYLRPTDEVMEFGGGLGRIGVHLTPFCQSLVSLDKNPMMGEIGKYLCPQVCFNEPENLEPVEFDFIYSIATFFHLREEDLEPTLKFIYERLKPDGRFLLDLKLGSKRIERWENPQHVSVAERGSFLSMVMKYFSFEFVDLFNTGMLLRKTS